MDILFNWFFSTKLKMIKFRIKVRKKWKESILLPTSLFQLYLLILWFFCVIFGISKRNRQKKQNQYIEQIEREREREIKIYNTYLRLQEGFHLKHPPKRARIEWIEWIERLILIFSIIIFFLKLFHFFSSRVLLFNHKIKYFSKENKYLLWKKKKDLFNRYINK